MKQTSLKDLQNTLTHYSTKCLALESENSLLKEKVEDLQQCLRLNKDSLRVLITETKAPSNGFQDIVKNLQKENERVSLALEKAIKNRNEAVERMVKYQQQPDKEGTNESLVMKEFQDKVVELQKLVDKKSSVIEELRVKIEDLLSKDKKNKSFNPFVRKGTMTLPLQSTEKSIAQERFNLESINKELQEKNRKLEINATVSSQS